MTTINWSTFDRSVGSTIKLRGEALFEDGAVSALWQLQPGYWQAKVEGTVQYTAEVWLQEGKVIRSSCSCPYDWSPICKHLVAVVCALDRGQYSGQGDGGKAKRPLTVEEQIKKLAKGIKKQALVAFLIEECCERPELFDAFQLQFSVQNKSDRRSNYDEMISKAIKQAETNGPWIDYIEPSHLEEVMARLDKRTKILLHERNWEEVYQICHLIINRIPPYLDQIEHEIYGVEEGVNKAIESLGVLIAKTDAPEKMAWQAELLSMMDRSVLGDWGFDLRIWDASMELELSDAQMETLLHDLTVKMNSRRKKDHDWGLLGQLRQKETLLKKMGRAGEARELLQSHLHLPEIRMQFIEEEIQAGKYYVAKKMLREVLEIQNKTKWKSNPGQWRRQLLRIAHLEEDTTDIRVHARVLFMDVSTDFENYDVLKSTYSADEWKVEVEKIIDHTEKKSGRWGFNGHLAEIFKREGYHDRLLALLQSGSADFETLKSYSSILHDQYPDEILQLYKASIEGYAQDNTGRVFYKNLVYMLRELQQLKGGETVLVELLKHFRDVYARRKAMMEIFDDAFAQ